MDSTFARLCPFTVRKSLYYASLTALVASLFVSTFFSFKIKEQNHYIDDLINVAVHQKGLQNTEEMVISLSKEIYRRTKRGLSKHDLDWYSQIESASFFNMTSAVSLKYGGYGIIDHPAFGPCGTMSRTLLNALWRLDIPARKLQLLNNAQSKGGGHTMIEFYHNGRWKVLSPSDNAFAWRNKDGEMATAREIKDDYQVFSQIYKVKPHYRYLFDNPQNVRWDKLPSSIVRIIRFLIGEERFNTTQTPTLYDQPRELLFFTFSLSSIFFGVMGYILKPRNTARAGNRSSKRT
ncbi:MAG: hypothetical protein HY314_05715 [Acidobacteria bacterium]|nr:hypothetical protein [Acidobacteriota bacterium]